jgi:Sulfotransferase domain
MATPEDFTRIGNYARMYNRDQNIDRHNSKRVVPMEVLCLGYSRTGTLTMQKAMEILGYPNPYHFSSVYDNVKDADMWMEAIEARYHGKGSMPDKKFWDGLLGHVGAISDAPGNLFSKELVDCYPEARVVLVERGLESWYESWMKFCNSAYNPVLFLFGRLDPSWMGRITRLGGAITTIQAGFAITVDEARVRSKAAYVHHYRDVKEMVPNDRLLEFNLKDGWQPLCQFLGKQLPVGFFL